MTTYPVSTTPDIEYATVGGQSLRLDLHRPDGAGDVPVVVYFHGGGWMLGDRTANVAERIHPVVAAGLAVASISYRFTDVATHPAQVHDAKAAVRWLRANGGAHGLRTGSIGAWGASAGGWIALMLGLTTGNAEFEGAVGEHGDQDSAVQASCAFFPVTDLRTNGAEARAAGLPLPAFMAEVPPIIPSMDARLLGLESIDQDPERALAASPIAYAQSASGPVLLLHGTADGLVNSRQSEVLHEALLEAGGDSQLLLIAGANHEGEELHTPAVLAAVAGFFLGAL